MDLAAALDLTGLEPGADVATVRERRRNMLRAAHPDRSSAIDAHDRTASLTAAFDVLLGVIEHSDDGRLPAPEPSPATPSDRLRPGPVDGIEVVPDGSSFLVMAPADEVFALLLDAASAIGGIGHVDRHLGLLEVIVRFEGGPSCSVLCSLQGRAHGTEVFCTMESIEAAPTPSIDPVIDALVDALGGT